MRLRNIFFCLSSFTWPYSRARKFREFCLDTYWRTFDGITMSRWIFYFSFSSFPFASFSFSIILCFDLLWHISFKLIAIRRKIIIWNFSLNLLLFSLSFNGYHLRNQINETCRNTGEFSKNIWRWIHWPTAGKIEVG